ncbi:MAG: PIN domain-containing protein [Cyanobacteria bacterium J06581_3]
MTLCDTGVLFGFTESHIATDRAYQSKLTHLERPLLTTWVCITEAMYLIGTRGKGWSAQSLLARVLMSPMIDIFDIQPADYARLFSLMSQYQDRPMDLADASLMLAAERTGKRKILTIDSDFFFYRVNQKESFEVIQL